MALCQRCGKGEAEWQCQVCRRAIDTDCAKPTSKGVFCVDHAPAASFAPAETKESHGGNGLKQIFVMLVFLTAGLGALIVIGDYFIEKQAQSLPAAQAVVDILKTTGNTILYGLIGLTILVGLAWFALRGK